MSQIDDVIQAIIRHLLQHPDAGDTLEGITRWWILQETIETKTREVQEAVTMLVSRGILSEREIGGLKIYSVKKQPPTQGSEP